MRTYGLIGYPLSHSFSPAYFAGKFQKENIEDCKYYAFALAHIEMLPQLLSDNPTLHGFNVTIPYKKKVIRFLDDGSSDVKKIIACNCVKIINGKLIGYNTDVEGFRQSLTPLLQSHHTKALVLGTGGAAAAVEYVLDQLNISFVNVSRNKLGKPNSISYADVNQSILNEYSLIINTTPVGMYPDVEKFPEIPYQFITPNHYLYDLVYNPINTTFLIKGKEMGAVTKNGSDMLIIQAEESWKIWNTKQYN